MIILAKHDGCPGQAWAERRSKVRNGYRMNLGSRIRKNQGNWGTIDARSFVVCRRRLVRNEEVSGSIPLGSTNPKPP